VFETWGFSGKVLVTDMEVRVNLPMKSRVVLLLVVALLGVASAEARETYVQFAQRMTQQQQPGTSFRADLEAVVLGAVNAYRSSKGLPALGRAAPLQTAARAHAMDMAINEFVGHRSSTGMQFDSRMRAFKDGALFLPSMGENAARQRAGGAVSRAKAQKLVEQWIKSPSHRRAMLNRSFTSVATAVVQKGDHLYAVQIFSGPEVKSNIRRSGKAAAGSVY
jgi:uncharacterized protein YkwD